MKNIYLEKDNTILSRIIIDKDLLNRLCLKNNIELIEGKWHNFRQYGVPQAEYYTYIFDNINEEFFNELEKEMEQLI